MTNDRSARVVARLRAHRLVPGDAPVRVVQLGAGSRTGGWRWRAVHAVSGEDFGVGSRLSINRLYRERDWAVTAEEAGRHVGVREGKP
jgi:hypothetical protein